MLVKTFILVCRSVMNSNEIRIGVLQLMISSRSILNRVNVDMVGLQDVR